MTKRNLLSPKEIAYIAKTVKNRKNLKEREDIILGLVIQLAENLDRLGNFCVHEIMTLKNSGGDGISLENAAEKIGATAGGRVNASGERMSEKDSAMESMMDEEIARYNQAVAAGKTVPEQGSTDSEASVSSSGAKIG